MEVQVLSSALTTEVRPDPRRPWSNSGGVLRPSRRCSTLELISSSWLREALTPSAGVSSLVANTRSTETQPLEAEMLTGRQQEIWDFLVDYVDAHGYPPTVREIGEAVGLASPSTVHAHLANLERAGLAQARPDEAAGRRARRPRAPRDACGDARQAAARRSDRGRRAAARRAERRGPPRRCPRRCAGTSSCASRATR